MNDKRELIRQKCIEANPDIVALKFGCEVITGIPNNPLPRVIGNERIINTYDEYDYGIGKWIELTPSARAMILEILGRPIRLADVLLAYSLPNFPTAEKAMFRELGEKMLEKYWEDMKDIVRCWNLRADDLEKQSEETIEFLYELLK